MPAGRPSSTAVFKVTQPRPGAEPWKTSGGGAELHLINWLLIGNLALPPGTGHLPAVRLPARGVKTAVHKFVPVGDFQAAGILRFDLGRPLLGPDDGLLQVAIAGGVLEVQHDSG